jgi:hypothetical protein
MKLCVRILHNWSQFQHSNYLHAIDNYNMPDAETFEVEAKTRFSQGIASVLTFNTGMFHRPLEEIILETTVVERRRRNTNYVRNCSAWLLQLLNSPIIILN